MENQALEDGEFDFKLYRPVSFSETKMANHSGKVYTKFRQVYPALVRTLEEVKEDLRNGTSTERDKAVKADEVQGGILNTLFVVSLSALADIYTTYGAISNTLQVKNLDMRHSRNTNLRHSRNTNP